jgi:hypothetical protein
MKTLKLHVNPIHRDLFIALLAGFSVAVLIVSALVIAMG